MGMYPLPETVALNEMRLERDWTFEELSKAMARAGVEMSPRTLHYILKRAPADARLQDRTLHKIRKFLKRAGASKRRRPAGTNGHRR